jgi:trafficking protein particle complex subunit 10
MTFPDHLIDNLVSSWTFAAAQQVLAETTTASLPISKFRKDPFTASSGKMRSFGGHGEEQKLSVAEPKTMIHPARASSLSYGRSASVDPPYAQIPASSQVVFANGQFQERAPPHPEAAGQPQLKSGLQELAGHRAQLYILERRVVEHVGKALNWRIGWAAIIAAQNPGQDDLSDVDLEGTEERNEKEAAPKDESDIASATIGLSAASLVNAVSSIDEFRDFYEVPTTLFRSTRSAMLTEHRN